MRFLETCLRGAWVLEVEPRSDSRGFFARAFCLKEFSSRGIEFSIVQANVAVTRQPGTIRGLHYQRPPASEGKLIRCTRGAVYDVIVDLRHGSTTRWQHVGVELSADNRKSLYVPPGFAHGYQTLSEDTEVTYLVSEYYTPECEAGVRYNDPLLKIEWPRPVGEVSAKDLIWPLLDPALG